MHNHPIHCCFSIWNPDSLLWWLLLISLFGVHVTGRMMLEVGSFVTDREGHPVSLMKLEGLSSAAKLQHYFDRLQPPALRMIRRSLRIDFAFMPCLYLLMESITVLSHRHCTAGPGWERLLYGLCWLPFAVWLLDVAENSLTLSILSNYKKEGAKISAAQTRLMSLSSCLKWILGAVWLLCMTSLLLSYGVRYFGGPS